MILVKSIATTALAIATFAAMAQSDQQEIRVVVNGERVHFSDTQPREINDRIMVPLRGVFEKMGAKVDWDPSTQTVTARRHDTRVKIAIGQLDASVNGESTRLDIAASLVNGVTLVPLRFVSEALGAHVGWDQANNEVDITSTRDYDIPKRDVPPPPPPVAPPPPPPPVAPPPPPPVVEVRPLRIIKTYDEMKSDTVIPLTLDTRLSSRDSKAGDPFSATVETRRNDHYLSLPAGTQVYGTVAYVKRQHRRQPGIIELRFDHLILPNGRNITVNGRLIGLDDASVMRRDGGEIVAKSDQRNNTMVFAAYSPTTSVIVSLPTDRPLQDSMMGNLLSNALDPGQKSRIAHDLELRRGTSMGLRLYEPLVIPRDDK